MPLASAPGRVLVIGNSDNAHWLHEIFGHAADTIDTASADEAARPTAARRTHRLAVVDCSAADAPSALASLLVSVNRSLLHDALALITLIPTGRSGVSSDELARMCRRVEGAGFVVERTVRGRDALSFALDANLGPEAVGDARERALICARKRSEYIAAPLRPAA